MDEKVQYVKEHVKGELASYGAGFFLAGLVLGFVMGIISRGVHLRIEIGSHNGYGNHHNGYHHNSCEE